MKKIKLLLPAMAGLVTLPCVSIPLTSCSNTSVEIKQNEHVTITADAPKKGEALVISYKLDANYAFDIFKSTIAIGNNKVVSLIQCTFDEENNKIYVPAMYITSSKIVVDIKAEVKSIVKPENVNEYKNAWKKITTPSEQRNAKLDVYNSTINPSGENSFNHKTVTLYKKNAHTTKYNIINDGLSETKVDECWSHPDEHAGYWDYEWMKSQNKIIKYSMTSSITDSTLDATYNIFNDNDVFDEVLMEDELFNCLWGINVIGQNVYELYAKFDSSKNISWYAFTKYTTRGDYTITSNQVKVSYDATEISFPADAEEDGTLIHRIPKGQTTLDLPEGVRGLGRYEFYLPDTIEAGKKLYVTFDNVIPSKLNKDQIQIYTPTKGAVLTTSEWSFSDDKKSFVINDDMFNAKDMIEMALGRPDNIFDTNFNKVTIELK